MYTFRQHDFGAKYELTRGEPRSPSDPWTHVRKSLGVATGSKNIKENSCGGEGGVLRRRAYTIPYTDLQQNLRALLYETVAAKNKTHTNTMQRRLRQYRGL